MKTNALESLKKNPIFQLSLSNKELFHSNFLYWLWMCDREAFKNIINKLVDNKVKWTENWSVYREDNNFDISIRNCENGHKGEYLFVLENKVKSIVTKEQLDRYFKEAKKANSRFKKTNSVDCVFCLLTLAQDFLQKKEICQEGRWIIVTYQKYAGVLKEAYLQTNKAIQELNLGIIRYYQEYIDYLSQEDFFELPDESSMWSATGVNEELQNVRLDDLRQKLIANKLALWILGKLNAQAQTMRVVLTKKDEEIWSNQNSEGTVYLSSGYVNGRSLVCVSYLVSANVIVRFEIEGDKYKRAVIIKKESLEKNPNGYEWKSQVPEKVMSLFDNSNEYSAAVNGCNILKKKDFGTYDMKNLMKYQGRIIPSGSKISDVIDALVSDLVYIVDNKQN